jgi:hypothetical protein
MFPLRPLLNEVLADALKRNIGWKVNGHVATIGTLVGAAQLEQPL